MPVCVHGFGEARVHSYWCPSWSLAVDMARVHMTEFARPLDNILRGIGGGGVLEVIVSVRGFPGNGSVSPLSGVALSASFP